MLMVGKLHSNKAGFCGGLSNLLLTQGINRETAGKKLRKAGRHWFLDFSVA